MTLLMADSLPDAISERQACDVLDVCRNSLRAARKRYFFCGPPNPYRRKRKETVQPRALSQEEREQVKEVLYSDEYVNQPPVQVYYNLLQYSIYLCSISTMHRLLRKENMSGERRNQRPASKQPVPRLKATAPNQVWSWDIAKLATQKRGEYLSLSRKENSALSSQLIEQAYERYGIEPDSLTLHQDRGTPMTAHCYLDLLGELAITASHSRPRVSNDNAFSEAQFKTLKYQPDYPVRITSTGTTTITTTAHLLALHRNMCSPVSMSRLLKYDKPRWMRPSLSTRNALAKGSQRCKCHHKKFALIQYRRMPTKKPLKKESISQPTHGPLKNKLIIKELAQMRLTCSGFISSPMRALTVSTERSSVK